MGKNLNVNIFIFFVSFLFASALFVLIKSLKHISAQTFFNLKISNKRLSFNSIKNHKIFVGKAKIMQVGSVLYVKNAHKTLVIKNIDETKLQNGFLYFKALGNVEFYSNFAEIYRYFNFAFCSKKLDVANLRHMALKSIVKNPFDYQHERPFCKYVFLISNVLKIEFIEDRIRIKPNEYGIPFSISYKINGKIRRVRIV